MRTLLTPPFLGHNARAFHSFGVPRRASTLSGFLGGVLKATHRSGINSSSSQARIRISLGRIGGGGGDRGSGGPRFPGLNSIPSNYIFYGIMALNGAVFVGWQMATAEWKSLGDSSSYIRMRKNFTSSIYNLQQGRWYTLITSSFSHENFGHIFFNGFTYFFFAPAALKMLGNASFLALYLGGGVVCSLTSVLWNQILSPSHIQWSHGASGAIYSIISLSACVSPRTTFLIYGIVPLPAWVFLAGIFAWDGYSAITHRQSSTDSAGHIGGLLTGVVYFLAKRRRFF
ncbi:uncharacterized protein BXZ73DRAFT_40535 [Epithele typhae]|uniref:uncharacterized protein n=1 Tax=Epithele typhae TaxID=378194 RepID=UPI002007E747|nr:uncharacterized protein BXZ73DRAFT_40535 [Epithele typhae]KAH9943094.1 hypothetical protein BXZ73DRAFT_40535 [Epithele typhae]